MFMRLRWTLINSGSNLLQYFQRSTKLADVNRRLKSQIWSSVVTVVLIEGKKLLPMDIDGLSDPYVKFRWDLYYFMVLVSRADEAILFTPRRDVTRKTRSLDKRSPLYYA